MKVIDSIVRKSKAFAEKYFGIKKNKIERSVRAAIDFAEEKILQAEADRLSAMEKLGDAADCPESLKTAINDYCSACELAESWTKKKALVEQLMTELSEEAPEEEK